MISQKEIDAYHEQGYLIIRNFISDEKVEQLRLRYHSLRKKLSEASNIQYEDYEREISQVRDIWKFDDDYRRLLLEDEIARAVPQFFANKSGRLLHDHIIHKPKGNNGIVPWHQDYTYWPVDQSNGLSFWIPLEDLDEQSGVLEVIPKSHSKGEEAPVDFINNQKQFPKNDIRFLTVNKGDLVVLHSLTWHRTSENISVPQRTAYISLWIDSQAKYAPKHADWHPVNDNVTVNEGEILNEDWFPSVGLSQKKSAGTNYVDNSSIEKKNTITMFNASKVVRKFLTKKIGQKDCIWTYLYSKENRMATVDVLDQRKAFTPQDKKEIDASLLSLAINGLAYKHHRGRNVYNKSYVTFKKYFQYEF